MYLVADILIFLSVEDYNAVGEEEAVG